MTDRRRLGRTDVEVTPIGLGCWQFAQARGFMSNMIWDPIGQEQITRVIETALAGGVGWFDTAEAYGDGASEKALAAGLAALGVQPGAVGVATKWWPFLRTARSIASTFEARLAALSPYPIDLYQVHQPVSLSPVAGQMRQMAALLRAGRIRAVGVSNFSAAGMEKAHAALAAVGIPLASNQVRFSLVDRSIEANGVLEAARRLGITIIAWSPLGQGLLTGRFHDDPALAERLRRGRRLMGGITPTRLSRTAPLIAELRAIAQAYGASAAQVALSWTVSFHGKSIVAIPGASQPVQATEIAAAMEIRLSEKELTRIDEASRGVLATGGHG